MMPFEEEPFTYPSRGLLRWADRWVVTSTLVMFVLGMVIGLLQQHDALVTGIAVAWFVVVIGVYFIAAQLSHYKQTPSRLQKLPRGSIRWAAWMIPVLILLPLALHYHFRVPHEVMLYLWPIFLPGLVLLIQNRLSRQIYSAPISLLTQIVLVYIGLATVLILLPMLGSIIDFLSSASLYTITQHALDLIVLLIPPFWAVGALLVTYFFLRRADLDKEQAVHLFQINEIFEQMDHPLESAPEVAALIHRLLQFRRVIIVRPDEDYYTAMADPTHLNLQNVYANCHFKVVGAAGAGWERWIGFRFLMTRGISGQSLITRKSQLVPDITAYAGVVEPDLSDTKSELNVPIFDKDRPDLLLALLVVQDTKSNAFSRQDQRTLEQIGKYLATHSSSYRDPLRYRLLQEELDRLADARNYSDAIQQALESSQRLFATQWVAFIQLGLGTNLPLIGKTRILTEGFRDPEFFDSERTQIPDGDLLRTVERWTPLFILDTNSASFWKKWATAEGIRSLTLVPVGNKRQRVGLLFLGFARSPLAFLSSQKLLLVSFAQAIAPHLTAYYLETLREGFMRSTVDVHRFLSEEELGRGEIQRKLTDFSGNGHHEIRKVLSGILAVQDRVYAATTARLPDFEHTTLHEELLKFEGDLKTQVRYKDRRITYRIDDAINSERPELQVILYRFMTEAVINALLHGEATAVFLRLVRLRERLILTVVDNGRGFDPAQLSIRTVPPDPGSILALSEHIKECSGGTGINWGWTAKGLGTFIRITIPLFPDPTAPQTPIIQDWIDTMEAVPNAWLVQKEARR